MTVTFATITHTGLVREHNEDAFFADPPVFVVADGMGGAQAGEVASGMTARAFEGFRPDSSHPEDELARLIARVNLSVYDAAGGDLGHSGMGTTITAAAIAGGEIGFAHVGDSRAYLWRGGQLSQITEDHSLVGEMVRQGKLTSAEAAGHPQRSIITRAVGVEKEVDIDRYAVSSEPGDVFLLCSDGLYSMVSDETVAGILSGSGDLRQAAAALVEAALAAGGSDNVTVVLFCPDGSLAGDVTGPSAQYAAAPVPAAGDMTMSEAATWQTPHGAGRGSRTVREWFGSIPGRIITGVLIAAVLLGAGWLITRQFYYVGVDGGRVSIFRGVPYKVGPWHLSSLYRSSPAKYDDLQPYEKERVDAQNMQSLRDAEQMLQNYTDEANQRKEEAAKKAQDDAANAKTQTTPNIIPGTLY